MAALLFAAFWIIVALAIVFVASNGGTRGTRDQLQSQSRRSSRIAAAAFALIILGFGIALPIGLTAGGGQRSIDRASGVTLTADQRHGRTVFSQRCGGCHTLDAANTVGQVGPNLDGLRPPKALILNAIAQGRRRGNGTMPAGIVNASDAQDVASFVSKVAGR